jgi:plastocyanin domain-containing protein
MKTIISGILMLVMAFAALTTVEAKASKAKTVKVTISEKGYTPGTINVKKGQKIRLLLTRTDEKNCGGEIVFSSLNIKRTLPLGKTITVEFTPKSAGEISFTCGMGMMKGKIVVQ